MFQRFTPSARRVVVLAQDEARMLDHDYIGTEHLLLGLMREDDGVAARAIAATGLTIAAAREQVEVIIGRGDSAPTGPIPFTPRAKKILELSLREALMLGQDYIGTEHILLGLVREGDGVGAQILAQAAAPVAVIRASVIELAAAEPPEPGPDASAVLPVTPGAEFFRDRPERTLRVSAESILGSRDALASIDRRLAAIERHLGIDSGAADVAE